MLRFTLALTLLLPSGMAAAVPQSYRLDAANSTVGFEVDFGDDIVTGNMPVKDAALSLDFDRPEDSRVTVTLDAAGAAANFPFATQALKGPRVLDTDSFPDMLFSTTAFRAQPGPGAKAGIDGMLTIRGVTHPVTLDAEIFRQRGQPDGELSKLSVHMTATVSRAAYGADGWADLVGDDVRIRIIARIERED